MLKFLLKKLVVSFGSWCVLLIMKVCVFGRILLKFFCFSVRLVNSRWWLIIIMLVVWVCWWVCIMK